MDIHFTVRRGDIVPEIESFHVTHQENPCPPRVMTLLLRKIQTDVYQNTFAPNFTFPFPSCPVRVTLTVVPTETGI